MTRFLPTKLVVRPSSSDPLGWHLTLTKSPELSKLEETNNLNYFVMASRLRENLEELQFLLSLKKGNRIEDDPNVKGFWCITSELITENWSFKMFTERVETDDSISQMVVLPYGVKQMCLEWYEARLSETVPPEEHESALAKYELGLTSFSFLPWSEQYFYECVTQWKALNTFATFFR